MNSTHFKEIQPFNGYCTVSEAAGAGVILTIVNTKYINMNDYKSP